jgi:MoxR-like ATPase
VPLTRIQRTAGGELRLQLPEEERLLLRGVAASTRERLRDDDPALRRLFPPASDDAELEREYRELTRGQLTAGREQALELLEATVDNAGLSPEEADAWLRALNDVRLVLGTELDVTEDLDWEAVGPEHPRLTELSLYAYVSWIQEQLVEALG